MRVSCQLSHLRRYQEHERALAAVCSSCSLSKLAEQRPAAMHGGRASTRGQEEINVPFQIAVHDGEEDLEEQVDGIYEDGEEV